MNSLNKHNILSEEEMHIVVFNRRLSATESPYCQNCGGSLSKYSPVSGTTAMQCPTCNYRINPLSGTALERIRIPRKALIAVAEQSINGDSLPDPKTIASFHSLTVKTEENTCFRIYRLMASMVHGVRLSGQVFIGLVNVDTNDWRFSTLMPHELRKQLGKMSWVLVMAESRYDGRTIFKSISDCKDSSISAIVRHHLEADTEILTNEMELPPWILPTLTEFRINTHEKRSLSLQRWIEARASFQGIRVNESELQRFLDAASFRCCFRRAASTERMSLLFDALPPFVSQPVKTNE